MGAGCRRFGCRGWSDSAQRYHRGQARSHRFDAAVVGGAAAGDSGTGAAVKYRFSPKVPPEVECRGFRLATPDCKVHAGSPEGAAGRSQIIGNALVASMNVTQVAEAKINKRSAPKVHKSEVYSVHRPYNSTRSRLEGWSGCRRDACDESSSVMNRVPGRWRFILGTKNVKKNE